MLRPFRPLNGRRSIGPPIIYNFGPSKITALDCYFGLFKITVVDRNFKPSKKKMWIAILDRPKLQFWTVTFDAFKLAFCFNCVHLDS